MQGINFLSEAFSQLNDLTNGELAELIDVLEAERPRVVIPAIAAYVELALCAATSVLYRRLEDEGDHQGALTVLERFASTEPS
jgi:hypothetical protein